MTNKRPSVLVLGGGLAGLTAARSLATHGFDVVLLEKSVQAGGKAGSHKADSTHGDPAPGVEYEHGYHIFATWYDNVLPLLKELGITLKPISRWHYKTMLDGWKGLYLPSTPGELIDVLRNSPLSVPDTLLYFYFCLDMIGRPLSQRAALDRVTRLGLMRSCWYATETLPVIEEESILKAAAVPVHEMSAQTAKILSSYFLYTLKPSNLLRTFSAKADPQPSLYMLQGDLQQTFIEPYVKQVVADHVVIHYEHTVTKIALTPATNGSAQSTIAYVEVTTPAGAKAFSADAFVVATPLDVAQHLLNVRELHAAEPAVGHINRLRTAPMAALHLTLCGPAPKLPTEHCFLMGGEYGLSFIDLTTHWTDAPYTLSFIASNFAPLLYLQRAEQYEQLINEITRFLPITKADVKHWCLFPNNERGEQLFVNTVGSWPDRPNVKSKHVRNLFFAGDWVKNKVDLACMEGAVSSALNSAREVALAYRDAPGVSIPDGARVAGRYPPWIIRLLVLLLSPLALLTYWWATRRSKAKTAAATAHQQRSLG
ncbi:MAG: FAD-dependent oxidoreductase [bacterium]